MRRPVVRSVVLAVAVLAGSVVSVPAGRAGAVTPPADVAVTYQGDAAHDGSEGSLAPPLTKSWTHYPMLSASYPVIVGGHAFVTVPFTTTTGDGTYLMELDLATGATFRTWDLGGGYPWSGLAYDAGRLFALDSSGFLLAIDPATGGSTWAVHLSSQESFTSVPTAVGGLVYTAGGSPNGGTVYAVSESTGQVVWTAPVVNGGPSSPAVSGGRVFVSYSCNQAYAFDGSTGALLWHHAGTCQGTGGATVAVYAGKVYTRDSTGNLILDAGTGAVLGSYSSGLIPAFDSVHAYLVQAGVLTALNLSSGLVDWTSPVSGVQSAPVVSGGLVFVGTSDGVRAVDSATGVAVWGDDLRGGVPAPYEAAADPTKPLTGLAVGGGYLLVPTADALVGYRLSRPGEFIPLSPKRVLDTRNAIGASGPVQPYGTLPLTVTGISVPGVPDGASAVVLNLTATEPTAGGYVTAYPAGAVRPTVSNLDFVAGQTVPNLAVVPIGTGGQVALFNGSAGKTQLVADLFGYFIGGSPTDAGAFAAVTPTRLLDTRSNFGGHGPVPAHGVVHLQATGGGSPAPSTASAVVLNVTVTRPRAAGFLTAYPTRSTPPATSNLNFTAGQTVANLVIVPIGAGGQVDLANGSGGSVDMLADIAGYYLGGANPGGHMFVPVSPTRLLDTRTSTTSPGPVAAHATLHLQVTTIEGSTGPVPYGAVAAVINLTVTTPAAAGWITAFPDELNRPTISNLNFIAGQTVPNLITVPIAPVNGQIYVYNGSAGPVNLIADVYGYYQAG